MWQAWRTAVKERKRAEKLLALEFPAIQKAVDALYNALYEKKFISTTELPSFTFLGSSELIALPSFIAIHVWQLRDALIRAEMSRKIAAEFLGNQASPLFAIHCLLYTDYMDIAKKAIDEICKNL